MQIEENKSPTSPPATPASETPPANPPQATQELSQTQEPNSQTPTSASPGSTDLAADEGKAKETPEAGSTDLGADDSKEASKEPVANEFHGFPEDGNFEVTVPDGFVADQAMKDQFAPIAKELDLSPKGVQKLVDLKAKMDKQQIEAWGNHLIDLKTQAKADAEIGGAKYDPAVAAARGVISKYGNGAFRQMLNQYGVGAHPEMIRFLSKVAKATGETPVLENGAGAGATEPKPLHELLYKD